MSLIVRIEGELAERIGRRAQEAGVLPEEFVASIVERALDRDEAHFERAMKHTLEKNRELYRRLAQGPE